LLPRCLSALTKAGLCLLAARGLRQMIEQGAQQRLLQGQPELAADALRMLWCPALLAAAGALFLLQALLTIAAWRPQPRAGPAPPPRLPRRQVHPVDPHLQACVELGLPPGSSWNEIRKHWRRQVIHWHPDRGGDVERWHQRLAAYQLLREREQRRAAALG
jgi:DnaJ domain